MIDILKLFQRKLDRFGELRQQQQVMINKEEDLQAQLNACRRELEATKASNMTLQKDKFQLMEQLRDVRFLNANNNEMLSSVIQRYKTPDRGTVKPC